MPYSYQAVCKVLPQVVAAPLLRAPLPLQNSCSEIHLHQNGPLSLFDGEGTVFLSPTGEPVLWQEAMRLSAAELQECLVRLCGYSLHSFTAQFAAGYFTTGDGVRVGVCMDSTKSGETPAPLSLNIRIAREVPGAADGLLPYLTASKGLILAGPPASGKTTLLRDLVRQVSQGSGTLPPQKCVVIDERLELSGLQGGHTPFFLGPCTDILPGLAKGTAIPQAVRSLSPQFIFCDEIASPQETAQIAYAFACGVRFVVTVHCGDETDLWQNNMVSLLMATGAFSYIILLQSLRSNHQVKAVISRDEYNMQNTRLGASAGLLHHSGLCLCGQHGKKSSAAGETNAVLGGIWDDAAARRGEPCGDYFAAGGRQ